jgi:triacylglycerol lipase
MTYRRILAALAVVLVVALGAAFYLHSPMFAQRGGHGAPHAAPAHAPATDSAAVDTRALVGAARAGIASLGKRWDEQVNAETTKLYAALHREVGSAGIRHIADVSYGSHPQQKLDLFVPDQGFDEPGPVLVYRHGGAWTGGDKIAAGSDGFIYANVGKWLARIGGIGVVANYRLLPDAKWPSGADDVRLVLDWVKKNIGPYGGDPNTLIVMGHSVGAMHLASYLFYQPAQLPEGPGITAAILASGAFDETTESHVTSAYFGENGAANLPVNLVDSYEGAAVPIFLWSGSYDVPFIESGVAQMYAKLCRKYADCPAFMQLQGHNHASPVMSIDSADTSVTNALIQFYHSVADR